MFKGKVRSPCKALQCNPIVLTIRNADEDVSTTYGLGVRIPDKGGGTSLVGRFRITVIKEPSPATKYYNDSTVVRLFKVKTLKKTFEIKTGYKEPNAWMEWVKFTAKSLQKNNCYACASGRPTAQVVPFSLG